MYLMYIECQWYILYRVSRIECQKVPVTVYIGLNSKKYLFLSISNWIFRDTFYCVSQIKCKMVGLLLCILDCMSKSTYYCVSWIEFIKVHVTVYLGLNA